MVACLLKAPLSFYANNPVGRIINRFSQDINTVEELLPYNAFILFNYILPVLATMILASITNPWLIIPFLLSLPLFYYIGYIYFNCSTDIKRLWLISSGPMYSHFSNTMRGLRTIRAHGRQKDFRERVFRYNTVQCFELINIFFPSWLFIRYVKQGESRIACEEYVIRYILWS